MATKPNVNTPSDPDPAPAGGAVAGTNADAVKFLLSQDEAASMDLSKIKQALLIVADHLESLGVRGPALNIRALIE